jgi:xanthine/CO dehydrogenase XdhC/CoxF family maturation factor
MSLDPMAEATRRQEAGEDVVLATAVRTEGSPPCRPGQKLLLGRNGPLAGTLGCSEFDAQAVASAPDLLAGGQPTLATYTHELGSVDVYLEPLAPRPTLVVLSATPVALHLLRGAAELGYTTVLVEDRTERVTPAHTAAAGRVEASLDAVTAGPTTDAVATDHDAPSLAGQLGVLLRSPARFVGMMGSARHTAAHLDSLRERGLGDELGRLNTPVGLDLGGRTPAEIALSILAGLVAARTGHEGGWLNRRS